MTTKQRFSKKIGDVNPHVSFEDMQNAPTATPVEAFSPSVEKKIYEEPSEEMIPKSQIDDYIKSQIAESLKAFEKPQPTNQKEELRPKKVETADDLPEFANWEEKDRIYVLCTGFSSLVQGIKDRHKKNSPLMYKGRSLRYSTSQASFFMDKQVGDVLLSYLAIENGTLMVPKENSHLQKFLAIHPDNGIVFKEFNPKEESRIVYDAQKLKIDAHILSRSLDTSTLVSVAMLMCKDYTENTDIFTVKRDLYNEIEINPKLFIKLASDQNLKLKSIGKIAVFRGLLKFANYRFYDENDIVICESNRNENEYEALASYFSTSEGRNLYEYLVRKIEN